MSDFSQYIKNIGHADFTLQPLNEVDIAILTELVYLKLDDFVSEVVAEEAGISLLAFYQRFEPEQVKIQEENPFLIFKSRLELAREAAHAPRYRQIQVFGFQSELDLELEKQFAAATFYLPEVDRYLVVFRGTDDQLVGWKEDFNMSHQRVIPAQEAAVTYLTDIMRRHEGHYLVAGHSKGANLAIYASAKVTPEAQNQIEAIYSFDGPGFKREFLATPGYQAITPKIQAYQPEDAVVSQILFRTVQPVVVAARGISMLQHMTETWIIDKTAFKRVPEPTPGSQRLKATLDEWIDQHSDEELRDFFTAIFDILESTGVVSLNDINSNLMMFLYSLQKEVRQSDDSDLLRQGLASLQAIYKEQGESRDPGVLSQLHDRLDGAITYFKNLVPQALLPDATSDSSPDAQDDSHKEDASDDSI